jgi:hypothetical protein
MTRPIADLDAPPTLRDRMAALVALVARQRVDASAERLRLLLADPQAGVHGQHATSGEGAEMRHLLYDADDDASVPAFPYPTAQEA